MAAVVVVLFAVLSVFAQSTYYVSTTGTDSSTCGSQSSPCQTINQVLTNYPGASYTVSIAAGTYATTQLTLSGSAQVIFQGTGNPTISATWRSGDFVTQGTTTGFQFQNLALNLSGSGTAFTTLQGAGNSAGLYNVTLTYSQNTADLIDSYGGSIVISNVTLNSASFDSYFILGLSDGDSSNITITGSSFNNLTIGEDGGFLVFDAYGDANIILNSTSFNTVSTDYVFIGFWAEDTNQQVTISNNVFNNTNTYLPSIYVENDYQCVIQVQNDTWNNATAGFVSGALETLGSDDGNDHLINLTGLTITNSNGPYGGAILIGFNSLTLSNSNFSGNSGSYGNDVVQGLDSYSAQFGYNITNSYSSSALPKAVIWNLSTGQVTDISDQLPNPSKIEAVPLRLNREKVSASPKFGRKPRKN